MKRFTFKNAPWFFTSSIDQLFDVLDPQGENKLRFVGGCVRDSLLGQVPHELDFATSHRPETVLSLAEKAGVKAIPTGLEHGTVTLILEGENFEVTSLREDIATDGRHAKVCFGEDWHKDAQRRDLTMNALYLNQSGEIFDPLNGYQDVMDCKVRFIGDAEERICEDYLRILRYFRFYGRFSKGAPDRDALMAIVRHKKGLEHLSAERVWDELKKILVLESSERALLWMKQSGVLDLIFPENWGLDALKRTIQARNSLKCDSDYFLIIEALMRPLDERVFSFAKRLKLLNAEKQRMLNWATLAPFNCPENDKDLFELLYWYNQRAVQDHLFYAFAKAMDEGDGVLMKKLKRFIKKTRSYEKPIFPISGKDLMAQGMKAGKALGKKLKVLEKKWVEQGFPKVFDYKL